MRRRALLAIVASSGASAVAGCSSVLNDDSDSTIAGPTYHEPPTVDGSNRSRMDVERPSSDHLVVVANDDDRSRRVSLSVTERKTGIDVYQWASTIDAGFGEAVYTLEDADPTGVQSYECTLEVEDATASAVLWTNRCYGDATLTVTAAGDVTGSVETC